MTSSYQWVMDRKGYVHLIVSAGPSSSRPAQEIMEVCVDMEVHIQVPCNVEPTRGGQLPWKILQSELCMREK